MSTEMHCTRAPKDQWWDFAAAVRHLQRQRRGFVMTTDIDAKLSP